MITLAHTIGAMAVNVPVFSPPIIPWEIAPITPVPLAPLPVPAPLPLPVTSAPTPPRIPSIPVATLPIVPPIVIAPAPRRDLPISIGPTRVPDGPPARIAFWHRGDRLWYVFRRISGATDARPQTPTPIIVRIPRVELPLMGLGIAPEAPAGYAYERAVTELPPDAESQGQIDDPITKKWWFWAVTGAAALAAAGTGYYFWRRRR